MSRSESIPNPTPLPHISTNTLPPTFSFAFHHTPMPSPLLDDDDLDWEAAVREIDNACNLASTSNRGGFAISTPFTEPNLSKNGGKSRQLTLDRFVGSNAGKRAKIGEECSGNPFQDKNGGDFKGGEVAGVKIDVEAAKTWIYPVNVPRRDYQYTITRTALFSNTLVALPTGLGKTLIAAVVMYNYFRWFPEGKIVFTAPSRPLVVQQIEACHNIVGISQEWTIDMTGQMSPAKRSSFWKSKRVFFVTPQVLEKDIQSGVCMMKQLVCLVIDEAHRASGNYAYCVAVRELMAVPVQFRILALTATPGSKRETIQNVINNLSISTLEYRSESDPDVSPYVHERKLELIQVALGEDATRINDLLLEVIRPFANQLSTAGVLPKRDFATLSPCELLNSRDKFRQAPPASFCHAKCGEFEGYYSVLITLCHIRKLLSSHGIGPAYDMLQEKLEKGFFSSIMSRNQKIWEAKLLMEQCLSHGVPNPKLVAMIDVLINHFKTRDPKESRVIIFSNFRGSVKAIMDSLSGINDLVKATEFIGQSSGKSLKGQSQKVQQAVLQKFRNGGYNVIVATSIGEEGLDIMEVDLVICFDANISPLRMIQRMGRTGRKHDGRVVVLACQGSELKGYLSKQASCNTIRKHMHNGGTRSFSFHPSPRMVPHGCRPEVLFVELSIEQFVPREKKSKDVTTHPTPILRKLSSEESDLLSRYFNSSEGSTLKPSLIAFPSFQSVPCAVHRVGHSIKTTVMLIDSMQHLQGLSFLSCNKTYSVQAEVLSQPAADQVGLFRNDKHENTLEDKVSAVDGVQIYQSEVERHKHDATYIKSSGHHFLFGGELLAVSDLGNVSILSIPALPFKRSMVSDVIASKCSEASKEDASMHYSPKPDVQKVCGKYSFSLQASDAVQNDVNAEGILAESPDTEKGSPILLLGASKVQVLGTNELSPRLTHFIEEGIVPESPVTSKVDNINYTATPRYAITGVLQKQVLGDAQSHSKLLPDSPMKPKSATLFCNSKSAARSLDDSFGCNQGKITEPEMSKNLPGSSLLPEMETPLASPEKASKKLAGSPSVKEMKTPSANILNDSSSDNWQMSSGAVSKSITQVPKYRRLCKYEEKMKRFSDRMLIDKHNFSTTNIHEGFTKVKTKKMACYRGNKEKASKYAKTLIEDEAEVSGDAEVSEDEKVNENEDDYDDSFIDDTENLTEGSTQGEKSGYDMMAMYRRSLLTQTPLNIPKFLLDSPVSVASSEKVHSSFHTPKTSLPSSEQVRERQSASQLNSNSAGMMCMPGEGSNNRKECSSKFDYRKKKLKLSFEDDISMPLGYFHSNHDCPVEHLDQALRLDDNNKGHDNVLDDDEFYQCLDLDAVEAQATELLRHKSEFSMKRTSDVVSDDCAVIMQDSDLNQFGHPSFDLGV